MANERQIDGFLEDYPMVTERPFTEAELAPWVGKVPDLVVDLLRRVGKASSKGFLFSQLPGEAPQLLEAWGIDPQKAHLFMTSAFGMLVFASEGEIHALQPFHGRCFTEEPALALRMLFTDLVTAEPEFDKRELGKQPLAPDEIFEMVPPVKLGGHFGNDVREANCTFRKAPRDAHVAYQASLYGGKVKDLPKGLKLKTPPAPAGAKAAPAATAAGPFKDPALQLAVIAALWEAKKIEASALQSALSKLMGADIDDEDEHIEAAVKALKKVPLDPAALASVQTLRRNLAFERLFETMIGVETGGQDQYMALRSLAGAERLPALATVDLSGLSFQHGETLDLGGLAGHPGVKKIVLGPGSFKGAKALASLPALVEVAGSDVLDAATSKALRAKKVKLVPNE